MSEDNNFYLTIKDLINETLIRDLVIFIFLFLLIISQVWENITLFLFPLVSFTFSIFFRIMNVNKWRTEFDNPKVVYNPLGSEKKHANRLFFSALFQLILIFWLGAESLYNPHIIDKYFPYFNLLFTFLYTFGYFWIFIDLWERSKIEIIFGNDDIKSTESNKSLISYLKIKHFKLILVINLSIFLMINIINFFLVLTLDQDLGVQLNLPGTGSAGSDPLIVSFFLYLILIISPLIAAISLLFNYKNINHFNEEDFDSVLESLPRETQVAILENLKILNKKIRDQLNIE
jgi:hypothetical protein